jgi:hypothetical protein
LAAEGVTLVEGLNYGGITIDSGYTGFTIDTAAIILNRSLAPGIYCLHFSLASDPSLYDEVYFTIPEYPLPTIAFADSVWMKFLECRNNHSGRMGRNTLSCKYRYFLHGGDLLDL